MTVKTSIKKIIYYSMILKVLNLSMNLKYYVINVKKRIRAQLFKINFSYVILAK